MAAAPLLNRTFSRSDSGATNQHADWMLGMVSKKSIALVSVSRSIYYREHAALPMMRQISHVRHVKKLEIFNAVSVTQTSLLRRLILKPQPVSRMRLKKSFPDWFALLFWQSLDVRE